MRNAFWIIVLAALVACPNTPAPTDAALPLASGLPWVTLQNGSSGRDVVTAQYLLRARGQSLSVDGQFGPGTQTAVQNFQRANSLSATGVVNADTWEKLISTVQNGSSGDAVRAAQDQLVNTFGYAIGIDGAFGNGTKGAVQNFQRSRDLTDGGIVEINTWSALVSNRAVVYLTDATARSRLSGAGISVSSSLNCSDRNNASCTSLDQVRAASIRPEGRFRLRADRHGRNRGRSRQRHGQPLHRLQARFRFQLVHHGLHPEYDLHRFARRRRGPVPGCSG
jgi:peptidoglycan hydrolase-like protein with peptidoglycan-binding domain